MLELATTALLESINVNIFRSLFNNSQIRTWGVFLLCLIFGAAGVLLSFWLLGTVIKDSRLWGFGLVIAVLMLGVSYGAKYANNDSREKFTPIDLIQYLSQGFLWPSTWPALAKFVGVASIDPPVKTGFLLHDLMQCILLA